MDPNPYAAPASSSEPERSAALFELPTRWTIWHLIRRTWSVFWSWPWRLGVPSVAMFVLSIIVGGLMSILRLHETSASMLATAQVVAGVISSAIEAVLVSLWLTAAGGEKPGLRTVGRGLRGAGAIIVLNLVQTYLLLDASPYLELLEIQLPTGWRACAGLSHGVTEIWIGIARAAVIAEGLSAWSASKRAWQLTQGSRGRLLLLGLGVHLLITLMYLTLEVARHGAGALVMLAVLTVDTVGEGLFIVAYAHLAAPPAREPMQLPVAELQ